MPGRWILTSTVGVVGLLSLLPQPSARGASIAWNQPVTPTNRSYLFGVDVDAASGRVYVGGYDAGNRARLSAYDTANGALLWGDPLSNPAIGFGRGVAVRSDGGVQIVGNTHFAINGVNGPGGENTFIGRYAGATGAHQQTVELSATGDDYPESISLDALDNSYVAGFANGPLGAPSVGGHDAFLAKHDAAGALQWIRKAGTTSVDVGRETAVDPAGNVYLAGETEGTLAGQTHLGGTRDGFLQKYDAAGNLLWQRHVGSNQYDGLTALDADSLGNTFTSLVASSAATLQKRDPLGALIWSRNYTALANAPLVIHDVALDAADNLFIAGLAQGRVMADQTARGGWDAFVAQLAADGQMLWAVQWGTHGQDQATALVADHLGSLYATGYSEGIDTAGTTPGFVVRVDVPEPGSLTLLVLPATVALTVRRRSSARTPLRA